MTFTITGPRRGFTSGDVADLAIDALPGTIRHDTFDSSADGWTDTSAGSAGTVTAIGGAITIEQTATWGVEPTLVTATDLATLPALSRLGRLSMAAQVTRDPAH